MLKVHEIFESIQGQGKFVGEPMLFIRLFGCDRACEYCDTPQTTFKEMSIENIVKKVRKFGQKNVCITGGEPTLQEELKDLLKALSEIGVTIHIFTNGYNFENMSAYASKLTIRWDIKDFDSLFAIRYPKELQRLYITYFQLSFTISCQDSYYKLEKAMKVNNGFFKKFDGIEVIATDENNLNLWLANKIIKGKLKVPNVFLGSRLHKAIGVL